MRRTLALLLVTLCALPALAGDKDAKSRSKKKGDAAAEIIVIDGVEYQPLPPPPGTSGVVVAPAAPAVPVEVTPVYAPPSEHAPCVNCSDPSASPKCDYVPRLASRICPKLEKPRKSLQCDGCSSFRCELRFFWGSCRSFFNEGPFNPRYPDHCPCSR